MNEKLNNDSEAATGQHWDGCICDHPAALASTPSPAQPTERGMGLQRGDGKWVVSGGTATDGFDTPVHRIAAGPWQPISEPLAPSLVQGANDRLAQAEAVIAAAQVLADANQVDHSGHIDADGEPCGEGRNWHDRWARDLHVILATYQQSPQAALNEVRAGKGSNE